MGPRLGRVEYGGRDISAILCIDASMGPRLGRVEYRNQRHELNRSCDASMGPRLGRVEYSRIVLTVGCHCRQLQWGHA